jgi:hypothetical protein
MTAVPARVRLRACAVGLFGPVASSRRGVVAAIRFGCAAAWGAISAVSARRRRSRAILFALCCCAGAHAQPPGAVTAHGRFEAYAGGLFGPAAIGGRAMVAAIQLGRDAPPEWGQDWAGYGRHFGYRYARHAVSETIELGAGALLREDPRYFASGERRPWRRIRYALARSFVVPVEGGGKRFAYSRIAAAYGSAWIANAWYPEHARQPRDVLLRGTWSVVGKLGGTMFQEFWPDLKRKLFGRP